MCIEVRRLSFRDTASNAGAQKRVDLSLIPNVVPRSPLLSGARARGLLNSTRNCLASLGLVRDAEVWAGANWGAFVELHQVTPSNSLVIMEIVVACALL